VAHNFLSSLIKERVGSRWNLVLFVGSLAVTLAICILVVMCRGEIVKFSEYGYIGVLVVSFLAAVVSLVPVPSIFIVFTLGAVLNPILVGLTARVGETLGSMVVYVTGMSSAWAFHALDSQSVEKFRSWLKSRRTFSVFVMSFIFNPLFYPFTVIAGMMRFGWWRFMLPCLAGKSLKNMLVAVAGFYGVQALLGLTEGGLPL